ncbi:MULTISPECIES: cupin domain-containing protein [unclassified Nocardioides]|uniref:cupin domain-containing protein n=1 Tax=unclassified Nocardioides TaxID=2615069 RepID=UPI0011526E0B|nr:MULTISPECIES: cupin domain-containing protein [unclassified Nocardioides]TQK72462.1 quercetin dioxygenase-like cupin family protein [Nocardioides sp. SLBN-35]WGY03341.1 cupin domain-containing protein [Nocardioides sp. QY071]
MESTNLTTLTDSQLAAARAASSGRAAVTVYGGREHRLRQTLIALRAGERLGEHDAPEEATLQVLEGEVALHAGGETWQGVAGDHVVIPPQRHDLEALSDAAVLLTVAN